MTQHHYTNTNIETAATIVSAGTCLEDTYVHGDDIILTDVGEAIKQVILMQHITVCATLWCL